MILWLVVFVLVLFYVPAVAAMRGAKADKARRDEQERLRHLLFAVLREVGTRSDLSKRERSVAQMVLLRAVAKLDDRHQEW